jgi:hypothetical protein
MSVTALVETLQTHPLVAIVMLDRLSKDPTAFEMVIGERQGNLTFVLRDAARGQPAAELVTSTLTRKIAEVAGRYIRDRNVDPTELRVPNSQFPEPLWAVVAVLAQATSEKDLAAALEKLGKITRLTRMAGGTAEVRLTEADRVGLVLRSIETLATDDLRALRANEANS